jgi:hypothetical protein
MSKRFGEHRDDDEHIEGDEQQCDAAMRAAEGNGGRGVRRRSADGAKMGAQMERTWSMHHLEAAQGK